MIDHTLEEAPRSVHRCVFDVRLLEMSYACI